MIIYIDSDYKCHAQLADDLREFEVAALDGKCTTYIDGYRYIPKGETWTRKDGEKFNGPMLSPWKDSQLLEMAQGAYEDAMATIDETGKDNAAAIDDIYTALGELGELIGG